MLQPSAAITTLWFKDAPVLADLLVYTTRVGRLEGAWPKRDGVVKEWKTNEKPLKELFEDLRRFATLK